MTIYEQAAREAGFTIRTFGGVQKIARYDTDGKYVVSDNGWRYACEDANILPNKQASTMKEVTHEEFFAVIYAHPKNIHPRPVGRYPYTSIWEIVDSRQEVGRSVDGGTNGVDKYFLVENNAT